MGNKKRERSGVILVKDIVQVQNKEQKNLVHCHAQNHSVVEGRRMLETNAPTSLFCS